MTGQVAAAGKALGTGLAVEGLWRCGLHQQGILLIEDGGDVHVHGGQATGRQQASGGRGQQQEIGGRRAAALATQRTEQKNSGEMNAS